MEHLSNHHEDHPNQHENSHKLCNEMDIPFSVYWKVNWNWENNMIRVLASEERNESKRARLRVTGRDLSRKVNHLSKVIWDRKNISEFTRSISSTRIGDPVFMVDIKVSKLKHISKCVDQENPIYVRWNKIKNHALLMEKVSDREKTSKTLSEVKLVKNLCGNLQSFLEISPIQKEVLLSHKLQDHTYE